MWRRRRGFLSRWSVQGRWFENDVTWVDHEQSFSHGGVFYLCQPTCASHDGTWHLPLSSNGAWKVTKCRGWGRNKFCILSSNPLKCIQAVREFSEENPSGTLWLQLQNQMFSCCSLSLSDWLILLECTLPVSPRPLHTVCLSLTFYQMSEWNESEWNTQAEFRHKSKRPSFINIFYHVWIHILCLWLCGQISAYLMA